ncbi:MAG: hypothetical protein ACYDIA_00650 [Candidatus Humimicrobiaceae bacterium]
MKPFKIYKYSIILLIILCFIFLISCTGTVSSKKVVATQVPETTAVPSTTTITVTSIVTVENTARIDELEKQLNGSKAETEKYQNLIVNIKQYLSYIYPMKVSNANYSSEGIGFSIKYNDKYFIISAGHGVHYTYKDVDVLYTNFKFLDEGWESLKLLDYNNDYTNKNDYAIFYSDKINTGFKIDNENDNSVFILGIEKYNIIEDKNNTNVAGESGSPIIDSEAEITGILTTDIFMYFTDIDTVLEAIDNLK